MRCPYCGENNPDDARRCSNCGCRLDKVREKKKEKNILAYGIILVIVILAAESEIICDFCVSCKCVGVIVL